MALPSMLKAFWEIPLKIFCLGLHCCLLFCLGCIVIPPFVVISGSIITGSAILGTTVVLLLWSILVSMWIFPCAILICIFLATWILSNPIIERGRKAIKTWLFPDPLQEPFLAYKKENEEAGKSLARARASAPTPEIIMQSALFEWDSGDPNAAQELVERGLQAFPHFTGLWMMKGKFLDLLDKLNEARDAYEKGASECPFEFLLWILWAEIEERQGHIEKASSVLETARLKFPHEENFWRGVEQSLRMEPGRGLQGIAYNLYSDAVERMSSNWGPLLESLLHEIEQVC